MQKANEKFKKTIIKNIIIKKVYQAQFYTLAQQINGIGKGQINHCNG